MRIYNSLSRKKEVFKPIRKNHVGLYTCGPTVYNYAHVGNLRTYIFEDILQRTLEYNGYRVKRVMNVTDVGHLTSDADAGEDKIEKEAQKEKKTVWEVARFYTRTFFQHLKKLNIEKPEHVVPATKYIAQQIKIIERLKRRGFAYETSTAMYFDVSKFKNYTKLSRQKLQEKIVGARKGVVSDPEKRDPRDFVLWFKLVGRFENHIMRWRSPWGMGFPGWHIECSAISTHFLGQPFDIHTGGVDHIGTHHTNEIAQSEAAFGKPLARYWMHGEFLVINKKRMGKSESNFITLSDLETKGYNPLTFRYLVLNTHYRKNLNFDWKNLEVATKTLKSLYKSIAAFAIRRDGKAGEFKLSKKAEQYERKFKSAINSDLNTPKALAVLHSVVNAKNITLPEKMFLTLRFDKVLGLGFDKPRSAQKIPVAVRKMVDERELYRRNKQFTKADVLRKKIKRVGYEIEDTPLGSLLKKSGQ